ncbi:MULTISPECIES: DUF975 family protein [unclassified Lactococcus]|uniref:DUF975 family protein n=1 Tax=unclassified Lactococcus TaxID=2643510 RepID=UPI0011CB30EA|nr:MULTISPECIES: DUF975 family protein [unclassified Lactococcus]MQW23611.1 DUF975 family protein [Lactococcus sp. dk101]TXK37701.1 DUF975 family protein [Lactococcus sp. dk310]TXK49215.1 DUF975 family protein [Lactococcus sp. dk322]
MNRSILKENAKLALRENFPAKMMLFIIPILFTIFETSSSSYRFYEADHVFLASLFGLFGGLLSLILTIFMFIINASALFNYIKIYRKERKNPKFSNIFAPFSDGTATKILAVKLARLISWIILACIPIIGWILAIYLALGWSQATFVLYDQLEKNTYHGALGVLQESSQKMKGWRNDYFIFQISFFWWYVLQIFTVGLINFWTIPYINMAHAAYYDELINH